MNKIAIIGAGPSGLLLALYLIRHSAKFQHQVSVTVFERENNHEAQDRSNPDRSYTIDITGHGLRAIRAVGANLEARFDKELIPFRGIHAYMLNKTLSYSEKGWTGSRGDICSSLLHEIEAEMENRVSCINVELSWNSEVMHIDAQSGQVRYKSGSREKEISCQFDLIIGADGGGSMLRRSLEAQKLLSTYKYSIPNYSRILHLDNNSANTILEPTLLHGFSLNPWAVGGAVLDVAVSDKVVDQNENAKKFYVQLGFSNDLPYTDMKSAGESLKQMSLKRHKIAHKSTTPSVSLRHYVSDRELESFAARPVYHTGKTVKCSTLAVEKCALIGDAATAFPPVGQGVNAAFEGATTLGKILVDALANTQTTPDLSRSIQQFSDDWHAQANACADIANTVVYGSALCRVKLFLQGAFAELTGVDIAAAQLAKSSEFSYVEALHKSQLRNGLVLATLGGILVTLAAIFV